MSVLLITSTISDVSDGLGLQGRGEDIHYREAPLQMERGCTKKGAVSVSHSKAQASGASLSLRFQQHHHLTSPPTSERPNSPKEPTALLLHVRAPRDSALHRFPFGFGFGVPGLLLLAGRRLHQQATQRQAASDNGTETTVVAKTKTRRPLQRSRRVAMRDIERRWRRASS